ncbi:hypothetical protein BDN72DRAFT_251901 [Pluteus cervinus]|uniref:Uncharacterized protein n=1 Tax=Pluteus cervinus TaxID=181527 RepID=A0ACD3AGS3_9AGAR|nr:hypothetical protein BDN72DRAFT_251901 [Pluteus cervinus]
MSLALPPTSNNLDHEQRARLIRSTRKLGALLGTTPCLVEETAPAPRRSTSSTISRPAIPPTFIAQSNPAKEWVYVALPGQSHASPSSSRSSSLDCERPTHTEPSRPGSPSRKPSSSSRAKSRPAPQPLLLRLQTNPISSNSSQRPPSPLSPTFSVTTVNSVPGPAPTYRSASDLRRKRMAKLTRTLGENIPPELVFGTDSTSTSNLCSSSTDDVPPTTIRRKRSLLTKHVSSKSHGGPIKSILTTNSSTTSLPSTISPITTATTTTTTSLSTSHSSHSRPHSHSHRGRSHSVHHPKSPIESLAPPIPPVPRRPSQPGLQIHVTTLSSAPTSEDGHEHISNSSFLDLPEWGKRKEREWSGEWNVRDMDDVVKGLRGLKGR